MGQISPNCTILLPIMWAPGFPEQQKKSEKIFPDLLKNSDTICTRYYRQTQTNTRGMVTIMNVKKASAYYTAVGRFRCESDGAGRSYPVILVNEKENVVDMQEMAVWAILSWRFLHLEQIEEKYNQMASDLPPARREIETCLNRLCVRGLIARGEGDTDFEALYDLLGELRVVPTSESLPRRLLAFVLLLLKGVPFSKAKELFQKDRPSEREAQVMALSRQASLSTAELIKCVEVGASDISTDEKLMSVLIDNDYTNSDSIVFEMLQATQRIPVTMAVANLYLRKQIIFERG